MTGRRGRPPARRGMSGSRIGLIIAVLAVCVTAATFAVRAAVGHTGEPKPLSTMLASQQPVGLAGAGPQPNSPPLLLVPRGGVLAFRGAATGNSVDPSEQWQADRMTDGSYVLVYTGDGQCLGAAASPGGAAKAHLQSCDLQADQRWSHPYLGKDADGRDYWQLRSMATGQCLAAAGGSWGSGTAAAMRPCGKSLPWQQLVTFWSAY